MKKFFSIVLIVALLFALCACEKQTNVLDVNNQMGDITFLTPSDCESDTEIDFWYKYDFPNNDILFVRYYELDNPIPTDEEVGPSFLETWAQEGLDENSKIGLFNEVHVDGNTGIKYEVELKSGSDVSYGIFCDFIVNNQIYSFVYYSVRPLSSNSKNLFNEIINSVIVY